MTAQREAFEAFISAAPHEESVKRFPDDATKFAWPGDYYSQRASLAWSTWQAAQAPLMARIAELESRRFAVECPECGRMGVELSHCSHCDEYMGEA